MVADKQRFSNMSAIKHLHYLTLLAQYCKQKSPSQFKALINSSTDRELKAICELILNILHGRLKVSNISKFKKFRENYRHLSNPHLSTPSRKRYLKRGRGFLAPLLGVALPALISLFKK